MGPGDLEKIIAGLPPETAPELLSSINQGEDAGVFLIGEDLALVQTVDFFPPIVDDPYVFGQIAAANALSDVYAMGGRPLTAMNLVAFPCSLGLHVLGRILLGGVEKVHEAGAAVVGGHTIEDSEPKYGLAVTGIVKPSEMTTVGGARPGDALVLTKPVGTGILATALKGEFIEEGEMAEAVEAMRALNREAAEVLKGFDVSACTDVTGFGLLGHLFDMYRAGEVSFEVRAAEVPLFERALEMASMGMMPAGLYRNREFVADAARKGEGVDADMFDLLFDPQTSGGLLASVRGEEAGRMVEELRARGCTRACEIGTVSGAKEKGIVVV